MASMHISNLEAILFKVRTIHEPVKIGDGKLVYATKVGKLWVVYVKNSREQVNFVLEKHSVYPRLLGKFFSLMATMSRGSHISNKESAIVIEKNSV